jgi:methyl-accepting chemotaxis protein
MPSYIANLSIAKRLGLGFALVLIMSLISILFGLSRLSAVPKRRKTWSIVRLKLSAS